jgi:hypothetical protein
MACLLFSFGGCRQQRKQGPDGALILVGVWPREWRVTHVEVVLSILDMRNIMVMQ